MLKWLKVLGVAAVLSTPWALPISAAVVPQATVVENTVAGGMDAAGEVSGTIVAQPFTTLSIFIGGTYSLEARFELQREVGSPGSGAFETVLRLDTNTADADISTAFTSGPNTDAYRVFMTVAPQSGDVLVTMTDASLTPNGFDDYRVYMRHFDDFNTQTTAVDADHYVAGDEAAGTLAVVTVTIEEGGVTMVTDTGSDGQDSMCLGSIIVTDKAGLVSDGWMAFEIRSRLNEVGTETEQGMGLNNVICALNTNELPVTVATAALTVVTTTDGAFIFQDGGATNTTNFSPFSVNAGVEQHDTAAGGTGHFFDTGVAPADDEYDVLRVEIDASGDAFFYLNGVLQYAEASAVATTATLVPYWWINSEDGGTTTVTGVIDWWEHIITRPGDAT